MSVTPMIYYKHNNFIRSVYKLYQQDGDYRRSAMIALAIMAKSQERDIFNDSLVIDKLNKVSVTSISGKLYQVYDLLKSCRLVVANQDQEKVLLFAGDTKAFNEWKAHILKEKPTFDKIKHDSRQLSIIAAEAAKIETDKDHEFNSDDFIKDNPDSVEAKTKQAIDALIIKLSENKASRKQLRQSIQQYRQGIKTYYDILEHKSSTDYDAILNDKVAIISEVDSVITTIEKKHHVVVTNKVEDAFLLIKAHQLKNGLDATQKLKDEVEFVEMKVKYIMALESLVDNMKIGITLSEKTKLINDVINDNVINDNVIKQDINENLIKKNIKQKEVEGV